MPEIDPVDVAMADILIRWHGSDAEPVEIGTVKLPMRAEHVGDGKVVCSVDASPFARFGKALAAALEAEMDPRMAVMAAQQRLTEAQERLARGA